MAFPIPVPMPLHASLLALSLLTLTPSPTPALPVSASVEQCVPSVNHAERSATFTGQMTAIAGTQRMAIQIEVQERTPADPTFHTVIAPGLGVWRQSETGVKIYKFVKQVTNLSAPAAFRALVRYRWIDDRGRTIQRAQRRTSACQQPAQKPPAARIL